MARLKIVSETIELGRKALILTDTDCSWKPAETTVFAPAMKTFDITWVIRKFIDIFPQLIIAIFIILYAYLCAVYFKDWGYRIFSGVKLVTSEIPMGGDFSHYWMAARLALSGDPAAVYDPARLQAAMKAFFGVTINLAWFYPPSFLLALLPLAWLPYSVALGTWLLTTLGAYLWVIRRIAPHPLSSFFALIFPGTIINFGYGQNGLFSTALLGGGLLLADGFPIIGGSLLGLLTYKPHLTVLVLIALIGGRRWKALAAMLTTALGVILASVMVFGYQVWVVFLTQHIPGLLQALQAGEVVHGGSLPWGKMPTFISSLHTSGIELLPCAILQGIFMLALAVLVFWVWRQDASLTVRGSILVLGTLLFTPYLFTYDLCLLALPLAWIAWAGYKTGWLPWEKYFLFLCWFMPMVSEVIAKRSSIPLAPAVFILLMVLLLSRNVHRLDNGNLVLVRD